MSYTTGTANSYEEVLSAIRAAAGAAGWTVDGQLIYKGAAYISLNIFTSQTITQGPGIGIQAGTGRSGAALTGASAAWPRLGQMGPTMEPPTWPAAYHIFTFTNPDEVYVVVNSNVEFFHWLAWGVSDVPGITGSGLWIGASTWRAWVSVNDYVSMTASSGGTNLCPALFWGTSAVQEVQTLQVGLDGKTWTTPAEAEAISYAAPHIARTPSPWLQAAPLVPIQVWMQRPSNKRSLVVDVRNARYIRIDNYTPGEIVTLGTEQWMVFPWYKKDPVIVGGMRHTGPFGWAIRYA